MTYRVLVYRRAPNLRAKSAHPRLSPGNVEVEVHLKPTFQPSFRRLHLDLLPSEYAVHRPDFDIAVEDENEVCIEQAPHLGGHLRGRLKQQSISHQVAVACSRYQHEDLVMILVQR